MEIKNAIIEKPHNIDDHGLLSAWLYLDYGGSGKALWVRSLPTKTYAHHRLLSTCGYFVFRCLEIAGAQKWEDIKGKTIRVDADHLASVESVTLCVKTGFAQLTILACSTNEPPATPRREIRQRNWQHRAIDPAGGLRVLERYVDSVTPCLSTRSTMCSYSRSPALTRLRKATAPQSTLARSRWPAT